METKARFAVVGIFISVFSLLGLVILLWIVGGGLHHKKFDIYVVKTDQSVGGLHRDSNVLYKGVSVGKVTSITIDKNNPQFIKIFIKVEKDLPVKTDTRAKISSNGITGISYVNLIGGSKEAPMLKKVSKKQYPIIKTVPTTLEKLSVSAGKVMHNMNKFLNRLNGVFNPQSEKYMRQTIKNLYTTTKKIDTLTENLNKSENSLNRLLLNGSGLIKRLDNNSEQLNMLIGSLNRLSKNTNSLINQNKKNINLFTKRGLENLNSLFVELKYTTEQFRGFIMELKQNPSVLIRGEHIKKGPGE